MTSQIQGLERKIGDLEGDLAANQTAMWSKQTDSRKVRHAKMLKMSMFVLLQNYYGVHSYGVPFVQKIIQ